jgi:hypothetical protein
VSRDGGRETGTARNTDLTPDLPAQIDVLTQEAGGVVLVTIGGGHYVPKVNDVVTSLYYCTFLHFLILSSMVSPPNCWHLCSALPST